MKKLFTSLALALAAMPAFCQITITQATCPPPPDSVYFISLPVPLGLPSPWTNQTWNYDSINISGATQGGDPYPADVSDPYFTAAQFSSPGYFKNIATIFGQSFGYYYTDYFNITATGTQEIGIDAPEQHYGIGALTGRAQDSLIVLDSKTYYPSSPRVILPFPMTASTAWSSVTRHVVNMTVTDSAGGLNAAPLTHVFYIYRSDSVIGWGELNAPSGSGTSGNMGVLIDRENQYTVDSFYLYGSPAPSALLTAFSINQGGQAGPNAYKDLFFRQNAWAEAMQIIYSDNTYSHQNYAYLNKDLPVSTGINEVAKDDLSAAYPNPFDGISFDIRMNTGEQVSGVAIMDVSGREVANISPVSNGKSIHIQLNQALSNGLYTYTVINTSGRAIATGKIVSMK